VNPVVSICCQTYNHKKLIRDALEGFLMQITSFPFEIIIHDDASTDGTQEIIRDYQQKHPSIIRTIFQKENQFSKTGVYPLFNMYSVAKGKYVADCDGDDYWTDPMKLQKQVDFMETHPEYVMCFHDYRIHHVDKGIIVVPSSKAPHDYSAKELIAYDSSGYDIHPSTKLWRNLYSEETKRNFEAFWGDSALTIMMGMYGACKYIPGVKPSVFRRMHGSNSWCSAPPKIMAKRTMDIWQRVYDRMVEIGNPEWIAIRKKHLK
jgi:glycosyltransferase involved in cell wall biosynthesis